MNQYTQHRCLETIHVHTISHPRDLSIITTLRLGIIWSQLPTQKPRQNDAPQRIRTAHRRHRRTAEELRNQRTFIDSWMISCLWFGLLFLLLVRNQTRPDGTTPFGGLGLGRTRTGSFVVLLIETQWRGEIYSPG